MTNTRRRRYCSECGVWVGTWIDRPGLSNDFVLRPAAGGKVRGRGHYLCEACDRKRMRKAILNADSVMVLDTTTGRVV